MIERHQSLPNDAFHYDDLLPQNGNSNVALLAANGVIVSVNDNWKTFARANFLNSDTFGVGMNYLDTCRDAVVDPNARTALEGIQAVMSGEKDSYHQTYPCHSPWEKRWFSLNAKRLEDHPEYVVVFHEPMSAARASEERGARIAGRRNDLGRRLNREVKLGALILLAFLSFLIWLTYQNL